MNEDLETRVRAAAFAFLDELRRRTGGVVRKEDVWKFSIDGEPMPLLDAQRGIRKPRQITAALSFRTVYRPPGSVRPYEDEFGPDDLLRYKWRGDDPEHPENRALRAALERGLPLIWFLGVDAALYLPVYPVWLAFEEPAAQQFAVAIDEEQRAEVRAADRTFASRVRHDRHLKLVFDRIHLPAFRLRVLEAYHNQCSVCHLRYRSLLDASRIDPASTSSAMSVQNGIALCKLHRGAFDANIMGITPACEVRIQPKVLADSDGPTLEHMIQGVHGRRLTLPTRRKDWPDPDLLAFRFERFERAA